ncbi:hypothetical protein R6242_21240 [Iodobacter sp. CM08]|uniref:hypothetical protein n=1 Tax=Iodobacter sp. CM08 TaxID=3085902 RepID=UPI002981E310|nr:hypothetical protein [Iodobacter sp. CM08]MDW5419101.1 hypothetical protein [Iodobacter sp. CM08]
MFKTSEKPSGVIKISGQIKNYKETRARANFFFTENDQNVIGMAAIGAAFAGNSGQAMGTAISASDMEEEADYLEFEMDDKKGHCFYRCHGCGRRGDCNSGA